MNDGGRALEGLLARAFSDLLEGALVTAGTDTAYTVTLNRQEADWYDGLTFCVEWNATSGTTPTILPTGSGAFLGGAKSLYWPDGTQVTTGDLVSGARSILQYDGTNVQVLTIMAPSAAASTTAAGVVELATTAETTTGTDTARAVTPDGLHDMTALTGAAWFLDTDSLSENDDTKVASQQSIKAYVDAAAAFEFVSTAAVANATTVVVTGLAAGYDYIVQMEAFAPEDDAEVLWLKFSDDDGVSYEAGASDYAWTVTVLNSSANTTSQDEADTQIPLTGAATVGNDAGNVNTVTVTLINPQGTSENGMCGWTGMYENTAATPLPEQIQGHGFFAQGTDAIDAIQFSWSGGSNFKAQGDVTVYRRRRS